MVMWRKELWREIATTFSGGFLLRFKHPSLSRFEDYNRAWDSITISKGRACGGAVLTSRSTSTTH